MMRRLPLAAVLLALPILFLAALMLSGWDALGLLSNTLLLISAVIAIALGLGTLLALLIARTDLPGRRLMLLVLATMLLVPLYLQAAGWMAGLGMQGWASLNLKAPVWIVGWRGAIWVHGVAATAWAALVIAAGLRWSEGELEEQALLDASASTVLMRVTLRRAAPAMFVAALWIAVATAGEMTITDLFQIRTYAEELYTQIRLGAQPGELTIAVLPGVALMAALLAMTSYLSRLMAPAMPSVSLRPTAILPLGAWRWPATIAVSLLLLALLATPRANLIYKAGVLVQSDTSGFSREWSIAKCLRIVADAPVRNAREFGWSFALGTLAASIAVAAALPLAWWASRPGIPAWLSRLVVAICLAMPGPLIGLGIIWLMNRRNVPWLASLYDHSLAAPALALLVRVLPLTVLVLWYALRSLPSETFEAAELEGADAWTQLFRIALPQRLMAVGLAWLVAFALCIGDLSATLLVAPPGVMTISNLLFDRLHGAQEDDVAGIALSLVLLFTALALVASWLAARVSRSAARR
jgi:iron(III) transport system permease protein